MNLGIKEKVGRDCKIIWKEKWEKAVQYVWQEIEDAPKIVLSLVCILYYITVDTNPILFSLCSFHFPFPMTTNYFKPKSETLIDWTQKSFPNELGEEEKKTRKRENNTLITQGFLMSHQEAKVSHQEANVSY